MTLQSVITTIIGVVMSLPRTLKHVSFMSMFSAAAMGIAILLFLVFAGIEAHPDYGYFGNWPKDTRINDGRVKSVRGLYRYFEEISTHY